MANSYPISKDGHVDLGPNLYATGLGLLTRNPWVTVGANVALALAKGGYGAYQLSRKYGQLASLMYGALLRYGQDYVCNEGWPLLPGSAH